MNANASPSESFPSKVHFEPDLGVANPIDFLVPVIRDDKWVHDELDVHVMPQAHFEIDVCASTALGIIGLAVIHKAHFQLEERQRQRCKGSP